MRCSICLCELWDHALTVSRRFNRFRLGVFLQDRKVPTRLGRKIKRFMRSMYTAKAGFDEGKLLTMLPPNMAAELRYHLYKAFIVEVPIFSNIAEAAVNRLASIFATGTQQHSPRSGVCLLLNTVGSPRDIHDRTRVLAQTYLTCTMLFVQAVYDCQTLHSSTLQASGVVV